MVKLPLFVRARWEAEIAGQAAGMRVEALFQQAFWFLLGSKVTRKKPSGAPLFVASRTAHFNPKGSFVSIFCLPWRGTTNSSPNNDSGPALLNEYNHIPRVETLGYYCCMPSACSSYPTITANTNRQPTTFIHFKF